MDSEAQVKENFETWYKLTFAVNATLNLSKDTLKIKKICFSLKVSIQPCRPKSDSALPGAIWAQFRPKKLNQKAIPAHARAHFSPLDQISPS